MASVFQVRSAGRLRIMAAAAGVLAMVVLVVLVGTGVEGQVQRPAERQTQVVALAAQSVLDQDIRVDQA